MTGSGWQEHVLVLEAKASPPVPPFRDIDRAFTRIRHAFRSDEGIQKAFDQAMRIVRRLKNGEAVTLYGRDGVPALEFAAGSIKEAWPVCVTADNFGVLATDLTLLLEKRVDDPFPWVTNTYDLESFLEALRLKGWGIAELFAYVRQRSKLNGKLQSSDELEIAGMFLRHAGLPDVPPNAIVQVAPQYSNPFDDIYRWKHNAGPEPDLRTLSTPPVITDASETVRLVAKQIQRGREWLDWPLGAVPPQGRNDPCPCGSGKKYKRCHGRAGA